MDHSEEFVALVNDAKSRIREISVTETQNRLDHGATLIDVREDNEWFEHARGAIHMGRGVIERDVVQRFPDKSSELTLYCGGGQLAENGLHQCLVDGGWMGGMGRGRGTL